MYARVSTTDKDQNPENQLFPLRTYATKYYPELTQIEYIDYESGKDIEVTKRKKFLQMFEDLKSHKLSGILVLRPDRFSRSIRDGANYIYDVQKYGFMDIINRNLHIDKNTRKTDLTILGLEQAANQLESALTSDRVKDLIARKRAEAEAKGVAFEWGKKKTKYKGKPLAPIDLAKVLQMYSVGSTVRSIALELGVGRGRIWDIIKNRDKIVVPAIKRHDGLEEE